MSGFFHARSGRNRHRIISELCKHKLIARLCRAFFMHTFKRPLVFVCFNDCPVMSGFFHALLDALEESLNDVLDSIPTVVIAQLCRAFFMHNCINFGINNGVNKNHLIFVLLMSVFYYSSFSFTFE